MSAGFTENQLSIEHTNLSNSDFQLKILKKFILYQEHQSWKYIPKETDLKYLLNYYKRLKKCENNIH